jgi:hypothetical protein
MKQRSMSLACVGLLASMIVTPAMALAQASPDHSDPYTSHLGPRASEGDHWPDGPQPHFQEPAGYDSNPLMHPYTSGIGPCPQGQGKTVCSEAIPPSR